MHCVASKESETLFVFLEIHAVSSIYNLEQKKYFLKLLIVREIRRFTNYDENHPAVKTLYGIVWIHAEIEKG